MNQEPAPEEVDWALDLFETLQELADRIWQRYEPSFVARCILEAQDPTDEDLPYQQDDPHNIPF